MLRTQQLSGSERDSLAAKLEDEISKLASREQEWLENDASKIDIPVWELRHLIDQAIAAKSGAYCPYSNFHVGCALLTSQGHIFTGANVENASYPVGICAERCAFSRAVTEGERQIKAVAVASNVVPAGSPCGMCRQFMNEFCKKDVPIFLVDKDGAYEVMTMGALLPNGFGPENLK